MNRVGLVLAAVLMNTWGCGGTSSSSRRESQVADPPTTRPVGAAPVAAPQVDELSAGGGGCSDLVFRLDKGTMNGVPATASMAEVKQRFPCSTGDSEEGGLYNYGGGVFFTNHDFYFYTGRDFLEVRMGFKGKTEPVLLGRDFAAYQAEMGPPLLTGTHGEGFYARSYGCLRIVPDGDGKMKEVAAHFQPCDELAATWEP